MKKFFAIMMLPLCLCSISCSDDDSYNADTAITPYEPLPAEEYAMVKSVKITTTDKSRDYSYEYSFRYDAQNRIKAIDGKIATHTIRNNRWYNVNIEYTTDYSFVKKNDLKITYNASFEYPKYPDWNSTSGLKYVGSFNDNGTLHRFGPFDCEYSGITLQKTYHDNGRTYILNRDRFGNITGYRCDSAEVTLAEKNNIYSYSEITNKTNIDFSALLGNWVVEREIAGNENWLYPSCQLAAFDMMGGRCTHLPDGTWGSDAKGRPVSCTLPSGLKMTIEYLD